MRSSTSRQSSAMCGVLSTLQPRYMTTSGAGADSARAAPRGIALAAQEVEALGDDGRRLRPVDAGGARRRAHLDAPAAARATLDDLVRPRLEAGQKCRFPLTGSHRVSPHGSYNMT